jgi:hypothetical protein
MRNSHLIAPIPAPFPCILPVKWKEDSIVEQAQEKNLKTPPESDPRKENRNVPAGSETSPGPEDFNDIRPKDDGTLKPIDEETPGLAGN